MKTLIINNETSLLEKLKALIPGEKVVREWSDIPMGKETEAFDLIVLSGSSSFSLREFEEKFIKEEIFVKNSKTPVIGICFGCELIARTFGGTLKKLPQKERGIIKVDVLADEGIFGDKRSFDVYASHEWAIGKMPEDFTVLARSKNSIMAIKHKTLPIYGFQFHPENLTEKTYGDEIFFNCLKGFAKR
jgi:GMP synthase-like glutamine amidotransferase